MPAVRGPTMDARAYVWVSNFLQRILTSLMLLSTR